MGKLALLFALAITTLPVKAQSIDPYYQISEVSIQILDESDAPTKTNIEFPTRTEVGEVISVIRDLIAFGKDIYEIVKAGKPVINTQYAPISVLPLETEFGDRITATKLANWKIPKSTKFQVSYKNGYGAEVVNFIYNVNTSYGGQFQGKGSYLANTQIVPEKVSVAWGYNFDAKVKLVGLTNLGSDEEPVAGATLELSYIVSTMVKEERNNITIFVGGDGTIQAM